MNLSVDLYAFETTPIYAANLSPEENYLKLDWPRIVLHVTESKIGNCWYSRCHGLDKLQITLGVSELMRLLSIHN